MGRKKDRNAPGYVRPTPIRRYSKGELVARVVPDDNPTPYYDERQHELYGRICCGNSLYESVLKLERDRLYGTAKLNDIAAEIKARIKITQNEIFQIGELLITAKTVCQRDKLKFQEWIEDNFTFSYETANNFMNVVEKCFGNRTLAMRVPISILYRISRSSFPQELREYLFDQGNLEKITHGEMTALVAKYHEGGFEAIEDDVHALCEASRDIQRTNHILDGCRNLSGTLRQFRRKLFSHSPFDIPASEVDTSLHVAAEINSQLLVILDSMVEELETVIKDSSGRLERSLDRAILQIQGSYPEQEQV
jgi:hypothetical protein